MMGKVRCGAVTLAKKKETTMSQMTSLLKALKHCEKVKVFVATATVAVRNAHAPVGSGARTRPAEPAMPCLS